MPNIYLEKIALSKDQVASARQKYDQEYSKRTALPVLGGVVAGSATGYGLGHRLGQKVVNGLPVHPQIAKNIAGKFAVHGGLVGLGLGTLAASALVHGKASRKAAENQAEYLNKVAAITGEDVLERNRLEDEASIRGLTGGALSGAALGAAGVGLVGAAAGFRKGRGFSEAVKAVKNKINLRNNSKNLGGNATPMGREGQLVPHVNSRGVKDQMGRGMLAYGGRFGPAAVGAGGLVGGLGGSIYSYNKALHRSTDVYSRLKD